MSDSTFPGAEPPAPPARKAQPAGDGLPRPAAPEWLTNGALELSALDGSERLLIERPGDSRRYFIRLRTLLGNGSALPAATPSAAKAASDAPPASHETFSFPANPAVGDEIAALDGWTYRWDGTRWQSAAPGQPPRRR